MNVGWEYMARRLDIPDCSVEDANIVIGIALQLLHFIGEATRTLSDAYLAEAPWYTPTRPRTNQVLVADFLSGSFLSEEDVSARAARFRSDLSLPHALSSSRAGSPTPLPRGRAKGRPKARGSTRARA
jgi:hypothetical protein